MTLSKSPNANEPQIRHVKIDDNNTCPVCPACVCVSVCVRTVEEHICESALNAKGQEPYTQPLEC
jgi:hypothetical protein